MEEKGYSVKEIASLLEVSQETVRRWIRSGKLKATRNSRKEGNVVSREALQEFARSSSRIPISALALFGIRSLVPGAGVASAAATVATLTMLGMADSKQKGDSLFSLQSVKEQLLQQIESHKKGLDQKEEMLDSLSNEIEEEIAAIKDLQHSVELIDDAIRDQQQAQAPEKTVDL